MFNEKFFGREEEKKLFRDSLKKNKQLLIFRGERGVGKTALLKELSDIAKENKCIYAKFKCIGSADEETRILKNIRTSLGEDARENIIPHSENIFTLFDDIIKKIESRSSQKNSDKLYEKLLKAFSHGLSGLSRQVEGDKRIIFFFDETERLSPSIKEWLRQSVEEYLRTINNVLFVFTTIPDIEKTIRWGESILITEKTIGELTENERKNYLQENLEGKETDNALINTISSLTGNPLALSLLCTIHKSEEIKSIVTRIRDNEDYSDAFLISIIYEILHEILSSCDCKKIVQRTSVLRSFNEDILNVVLGKECQQEKCSSLKKCSGESYLDKIKKTLLTEINAYQSGIAKCQI
ncbi:MAG: ATP-binding protein [Candidatus Electrothrix sp. AR1]|nr:ATP-binding protein [Candidatus Electrothrix sp. AR1]